MHQLAVVIEPIGCAVKAGDDKVPRGGREDGGGLAATPGDPITKAIADLTLINHGERWVALGGGNGGWAAEHQLFTDGCTLTVEPEGLRKAPLTQIKGWMWGHFDPGGTG